MADTDAVRLNAPVVRFAMRVLGWNQAELARRTDVSEATVSRALAGHTTTSRVASQILAAIPGPVSIGEIVDLGVFSPGLPRGAEDKPLAEVTTP